MLTDSAVWRIVLILAVFCIHCYSALPYPMHPAASALMRPDVSSIEYHHVQHVQASRLTEHEQKTVKRIRSSVQLKRKQAHAVLKNCPLPLNSNPNIFAFFFIHSDMKYFKNITCSNYHVTSLWKMVLWMGPSDQSFQMCFALIEMYNVLCMYMLILPKAKELSSRLLRVISAKLTLRSVSYTGNFMSVLRHHSGDPFRQYNITLGSYSGNNGGDGDQTHNLAILSPML